MASWFSRVTSGPDEVSTAIDEWVSEGIIDTALAERLRFSTRERLAQAPAVLSPAAELGSYIGIVVALGSGAFLTTRLWRSFGVSGQAAVGAVLALVGLIVGARLTTTEDPGMGRLGRFMWFVGTGGVAMTTSVLTDTWSSHRPGVVLIATGTLVAVVSGVLWMNRPRPLQFLTTGTGLTLLTFGVLVQADWNVSPLTGGLVMWGVGAALCVGARTVLSPPVTAFIVGTGSAYMGSLAITSMQRPLGLTLGVASAVAVTAMGLGQRVDAYTALGVIGVLIFAMRVMAYYVRGTGPLLAMFALALAVVVVIVVRAMRPHPGAPAGTRARTLSKR